MKRIKELPIKAPIEKIFGEIELKKKGAKYSFWYKQNYILFEWKEDETINHLKNLKALIDAGIVVKKR